jgi:hypothetical protein
MFSGAFQMPERFRAAILKTRMISGLTQAPFVVLEL